MSGPAWYHNEETVGCVGWGLIVAFIAVVAISQCGWSLETQRDLNERSRETVQRARDAAANQRAIEAAVGSSSR